MHNEVSIFIIQHEITWNIDTCKNMYLIQVDIYYIQIIYIVEILSRCVFDIIVHVFFKSDF